MRENEKTSCKQTQRALLKLLEVGMYWSSIKGRFQGIDKQSSGAQRRIYLGMKYGSIWINNLKLTKNKPQYSNPAVIYSLAVNHNPNICKMRNKLGLNSIEDRLIEI